MLVQADLRSLYVEHSQYEFDIVLNDTDDNAKVYDSCARPLVEGVLCEGSSATIIMFGQTGSGQSATHHHACTQPMLLAGKTYTMNSIIESACEHMLSADVVLESGGVQLSYYEIDGTAIRDLLNPEASISLADDSEQRTQVLNATKLQFTDPALLLEQMRAAGEKRASAATGANEQSSRSHALCELTVADDRRITLVDLAGSEWAADRSEHNPERQQEGARINSSLMSLKQCLRAKQHGGHAPFRDSKLTHALREALTAPEYVHNEAIDVVVIGWLSGIARFYWLHLHLALFRLSTP